MLVEAEVLQRPGWTADELDVLRRGSFVAPPEDFPEVGEGIEVEHVCPRCGYQFSGGQTVEKQR